MAEDELQQSVRDLIDDVVRRTRLWRSERRDVRAELESHFREGLAESAKQGLPVDQAVALLRERFGDPKLAAMLIRRGKKRARSMIWKLFARTTYAIVLLVGVTGAYAGWLLMGQPSPSVDYVAKLNEPIDAIPYEDRAWPIWKQVILDFKRMPEELKEDADKLYLLGPEDEKWPVAVAWLDANRHLIPAMRRAAAKSAYGYRYDNTDVRAFNHQVSERRGEPAPADNQADASDALRTVSPMIELLLPNLRYHREIARFLVLDARAHLEDGDFGAAWASLDTTCRLGVQLFDGATLIDQLVGAVIVRLATDAMIRSLYEWREERSRDALRNLGRSHLMMTDSSVIRADFAMEKDTHRDVIQHVFTDDGHGDGTLIPGQLAKLFGTVYGGNRSD